MIKLLILSLLLIGVYCHNHRKCGGLFDMELEKIDTGSLTNDFSKESENDIYNRVLQQSSSIRITYDENYLNLSENKKYKYTIKNAMDTAINFFSKLITPVNPVTTEFTVESCGDYPISANQKLIRHKSDMHFYIQMKSDSSNWLAQAGACKIQSSDNRPIAGLVKFNTNYLSDAMKNMDFQNLVEMTIHELFHALVFNPEYFKLYSKKYTTSQYNTGSTPWIAFPNVLKFAQDHYTCNTIDKVYLEDDGSTGSKGAHWERTLFYNDIMTASEIAGDQVWSGLNNALLKDSGWYTLLDETQQDTIYWGKGKGCDFYKSTCSYSPLFEEFCNSSTTTKTGYYFTGYGECQSSDPYLDNSCKYMQTYENTICYNEKNNSDSRNTDFVKAGSKFGWNSKAVSSTLRPTGQALPGNKSDLAQCYPSQCISTGVNTYKIQFTVGSNNSIVECTSNNESKTLSGYEGTLTCPNIPLFCQRNYNCENFCNSGGYCQKNTCTCTPGFSGPNCKCGNGTYWKNNICNKCSLQNCWKCDTNDSCVACADGYKLDTAQAKCVQEAFDDTFSSYPILQLSLTTLIAFLYLLF